MNAVSTAENTDGTTVTVDQPPLRARRAGQLLSDQDYTPIIRLQPGKVSDAGPSREGESGPGATRPGTEPGPGIRAGGSPSDGDLAGVDAAAERKRVTGVATSMGLAAVEVLAGTRPAVQLSRWLDPDSYERLLLRSTMVRQQRERFRGRAPDGLQQLHRNPQVRSARLCRLSPTVYEAALVVVDRTRPRAVALRLERRNQLWKVAAMEIG